jgi:hypothetical protein
MKQIPLTLGQLVLVDDCWYELLISMGKWHAIKHRNTFYAVRNSRPDSVTGKRIPIRMHRVILGLTDSKIQGEHANGNGLDNQLSNLRFANNQQNSQNRGMNANNTSGFKGVSWRQREQKWVAQTVVDGKKTFIGYFNDPNEAARAYDQAAVEHFGEFARPNFPSEVT